MYKMEEKKIIELIVRHKIEYEKGITDYLKNLLFRMIKILIICFSIYILFIQISKVISASEIF